MKFLLDMGISPRVARFLHRRGQEVAHLQDEGLDRLPDPDILTKAREEGAVLLTHDLDFAELVAASQARLPSVVIFRLRDMRPESVIAHLEGVLDTQSEALREGAMLSVTEGRIRRRMLPIGSTGTLS